MSDGVPGTPEALGSFHPLLQRWFRERYPAATDVQARAWPAIAAGRNILAVAPTGSGKTLCAFLWPIHQLVTGAWTPGTTRVLYVSPLKALNNDIHRNLRRPLGELRQLFEREATAFPEIRVLTRSGDTPERERQQMLRRPPEILITTPESLNLLLSSPRARGLLTGLKSVILDEIHAVASTKRGTHLMTAVERLVLLSGDFQRIALSATVSPPERVAAFVGGFRLERTGGGTRYVPRAVEVIRSPGSKPLELSVWFPPASSSSPVEGPDRGPASRPSRPGWQDPFWEPFIAACLARIEANRSTLIFTNTRRHAEKTARLINERAGQPLAYAHHGSLSKEIRAVVEHKLKAGELAAIVATSSLELGIDIGALDEVLLLQTPFSVASALQRIGRAGHSVGEVSRGRLYATHGRDLLNAAVMAVLVRQQGIEEVRPIENPLDVLAQVILSMTGIEPWDIDRLFDTLRTCSAFGKLPRRHFDLVLDMLAGRYADSRIRELKPRVLLDRQGNSVRGRGATLPLLYRSGGTIPDRGYYELRIRDAGARIGELDEEFVWERKEGDTFSLGTQNWKITRIDPRSVEVVPWNGPVGITPFWRAEKGGRDFGFCEAVARFLEQADGRLGDSGLVGWLKRELLLNDETAESLGGFLRRQRRATGAALPHRHHLLIEHVGGSLTQEGFRRVVVHTLWGGRVNEPLALALSAAWELQHRRAAAGRTLAPGAGPEIFADDDCLMIIAPPGLEPAGDVDFRKLMSLLSPGGLPTRARLEELLRLRLESSGRFVAAFRENAGRALLLPRSDLRRRIPLWLTRLRSKNMLAALRSYEDFPVLLETWRSCLQDEFDLDTLAELLGELKRGVISISDIHTGGPSPFAENIAWIQTDQHMYETDALAQPGESRVSGGLIREIAYAAHLRPRIDPSLVVELERKLHRTASGYSPADGLELWDWIRERLFVPLDEWESLLEAMQRDHALDPALLWPELRERLSCCRLPGALEWGMCARETLPRLLSALRAGGAAPGTNSVEPVALDTALIDSIAIDTVPLEAASVKALATGAAAIGILPVTPGSIERRGAEGEGAAPPDLASLLGEWLRFYGPLDPGTLTGRFGISPVRLAREIGDLVENALAVYDPLTVDAADPQVCDAENLEILLRLMRRSHRPAVTARPLAELPLLLAGRQGLLNRGAAPRNDSGGEQETAPPENPEVHRQHELEQRLEALFGFPAPAALWEQEILPARLSPYYGRCLDTLLRDSQLMWFGCGRERLAFCLAADYELFREVRNAAAPEGQEAPLELLPDPRGSYSIWDIADHSGLSTAEATREIWRTVWEGGLAGEGFGVMRRGLRSRFRVDAPSGDPHEKRGRRSSFDRWRLSRPLEARWFALHAPEARDLVNEEELNRERVRQLLQRYGVLFRELLARELPLLRWSRVFRTLRVMELSGEVLSGYFFESLQGPQFLAPEALSELTHEPAERGVFWMNAADPASPCGLGLELPYLPARLPSNHLVFDASRLVLVSTRRGRNLEVHVPPADPHLGDYLEFLNVLMRREWRPWNSVRVESINGIAARESDYKQALLEFGFVEEVLTLVLRAGV